MKKYLLCRNVNGQFVYNLIRANDEKSAILKVYEKGEGIFVSCKLL